MSAEDSNASKLIELIKRRAPECLDLLTAENDQQFDAALDVLLEKAVAHLESNKANFATLGEEALTGVLRGALSMPGLNVTQETHSNGHVDLTVEMAHCSPALRRLGEAKIYNGSAYHYAGLEQLLGRYSTGRDCRGLLIVYFRKQKVEQLVKKLRKKMDTDLPCKQIGATTDHPIKWSFLSNHGHSSGGSVCVRHVGCNLYVET